jgi:hypothetical protein
MHLRKLVPLADLLTQAGGGPALKAPKSSTAPPHATIAPREKKLAPTSSQLAPTSTKHAPTSNKLAPTSDTIAPTSAAPVAPTGSRLAPTSTTLKDSLLAEIRAGKLFFYNTVVAQAQKIEVADDRVTFTFLPAHRALREQFDQSRAWLEAAAERVAGRRISVTAVQAAADGGAGAPAGAPQPAGAPGRDLKAEAMSSPGVQAMLDVFPADIRDVEEL